MAHYDTFRVQLAIAHPALGHALWEPEPGEHFPPVEVGDVGFIRQGKFHRLFNAMLPANHPSHDTFRVPEGHEPLRPSMSNHVDHGSLYPNNFCSYGVRVTPGGSEIYTASGPPAADTVDVSFSCARKQGAVLSLPVAAQRNDTFALGHFRRWITRNIDSWFAFTQRHELGIEMEDIVFVTGCHRTRSWSNIAFYEGQAGGRVSFGVQVPDINGTAVNWQVAGQYAQGAMLNHGPSGENLPENQCIFVRGFRIKRSFKIFPRVKGAAEPPPDSKGTDDELEIEAVSIASVPEYRDPLHVLLEYMAEEAPDCDFVLVHDDDLERILRVSNGTSLETLEPAEMMSHLQRSNLEIGVAAIPDRSPSNDEGSRTGTTFTIVAMLSEQPKSDDSSSDPLPSHISVGTTDEEESVHWQYDALDLPEVVTARLEMAEPAEPSRVAYLVALLYVPIPECLSTADVLVSINNVDARIILHRLIHRRRLSISSQADLSRPIFLLGMAMTRLEQHMLSNQIKDLETSILHLTESLLFPPRSWLEHGPEILGALFFLALALIKRSEASKRPEDAIHAAKYLRYLRDQPRQTFGISRDEVTTFLMHSLVIQVISEAGNVMRNMGEMAVLCHELLTSDMSHIYTTHAVTLFATVVLFKFRPWEPDQPLDQVIECLRTATKHIYDLHEARVALIQSLVCRYCMTFLNDDYEEAMSAFEDIINYSSFGFGKLQDKFVAIVQQIVTKLAMIRSMVHDTPEYSEEAIYRAHSFLRSSPQEHPCNSVVNDYLEATAKQRFHYFSTSESLEALSQPMAETAFGEDEDDDSEVGQIIKKVKHLGGLLTRILNNDITKINEAIGEGRTILASSAPRGLPTSYLFELFGLILFEAFQRTDRIGYLNESINTRRQILERPLPQLLRSSTLLHLSLSLFTRSQSFPGLRTRDLDEGLELLSRYVNDGHTSLPDRFQVACLWASLARGFRHPTVSTAYESALSLMQSSLLFAPTLQLQHATLVASNRSMPLDYASYQVDLHQLEQAVETLERGRALLWSEMRHLRAPIDQLLQANPQLADKFAAISRDLEALTKSIPPSPELSMDDDATDDLRAVDPFGRLLLKQRTLLKEREDLISQIQDLPGFDSFLKSPSFDTLRSAALSGPVIIINHSRRRSDILILLHNTSPSLIPTPHNFYHRASALKELLDSKRKHGLDSSDYHDALASVLVELYNLVGKPVTDRLRELQVPEQSRIWWCPTSVFCSLPLHAMGPIPSDGGESHYFMDLYVCSYTPTLSALIQSRNRNLQSRPLDRPSILLVAPDPYLPYVGGEIQVVQSLDTEVTSLISGATTSATVIDGLHHHQFVHFVGSGTLEAGKPFEAGFELLEGRLTLLDIVQLDLPAAEFAFLSACRTAQITEGSVADEVLHLAAAVQFCGFNSVVAAMWEMVDEDGPDLAKHFYKALFSTSRLEEGIPYHERSAKALQFAVKKLRRKRRITLERWVNFVHYGA